MPSENHEEKWINKQSLYNSEGTRTRMKYRNKIVTRPTQNTLTHFEPWKWINRSNAVESDERDWRMTNPQDENKTINFQIPINHSHALLPSQTAKRCLSNWLTALKFAQTERGDYVYANLLH